MPTLNSRSACPILQLSFRSLDTHPTPLCAYFLQYKSEMIREFGKWVVDRARVSRCQSPESLTRFQQPDFLSQSQSLDLFLRFLHHGNVLV